MAARPTFCSRLRKVVHLRSCGTTVAGQSTTGGERRAGCAVVAWSGQRGGQAPLDASFAGTSNSGTDELATQPYRLLASDEVEEMIRLLSAIGRRIVTSGEIPFPNPMGLPEPGAAE
jgi:hypothetical protein